jgi:hypothetical protein
VRRSWRCAASGNGCWASTRRSPGSRSSSASSSPRLLPVWSASTASVSTPPPSSVSPPATTPQRVRSEAAWAHLCGVARGHPRKTHPPAPAQPRREPPSQPRPVAHRVHPPRRRSPHPHLRPPPPRPRTIATRDHPHPQALHRPGDLPTPPAPTDLQRRVLAHELPDPAPAVCPSIDLPTRRRTPSRRRLGLIRARPHRAAHQLARGWQGRPAVQSNTRTTTRLTPTHGGCGSSWSAAWGFRRRATSLPATMVHFPLPLAAGKAHGGSGTTASLLWSWMANRPRRGGLPCTVRRLLRPRSARLIGHGYQADDAGRGRRACQGAPGGCGQCERPPGRGLRARRSS